MSRTKDSKISNKELDEILSTLENDNVIERYHKLVADLRHLETAIEQKRATIEHGKNYVSYFQLKTHKRGLFILYNAKKGVIKKLRLLAQKNIFD